MARKEIEIDNKKVQIEANGATILIYEDTFKGRRFLRDVSELEKVKEPTDYPLTLTCRILWATAKTADNSIPNMFKWAAQFTSKGLLNATGEAMKLIGEDMKSTVKN